MAEDKKLKRSDIERYRDEYTSWRDDLVPRQTRFQTNYDRYTGLKEMKGTQAKIQDPVAFELTERMVQKMFEQDPKFFADSRGKNLPREVKQVMNAVAEFIWNNQDTVQQTGTMRSKLKVAAREFINTGNLATETYYNVVADSPDLRVLPIENVVFDPSKTLKTSPLYYTDRTVSIDYLEDNKEITKDGKVVTGMFSTAAIKKLKRIIGDRVSKTDDTSDNRITRSSEGLGHKQDEFRLISRYYNDKVCRFVWDDDMEDPIAVQEFVSILGEDPLDFAMDIEVVNEPYALSVMDSLIGMFRAKDLILSQTIDYGAKVLNPATIVNPNADVNLKTIANMYKLGGIVLADPNQIKQAEISNAPQRSGIDMMNWIEGRGEAVTGASAYVAGVTNSETDKTQGTKGGIEALQQAGSSPITDRQTNIEESIIEPFMNKALKMVGATMSEDDFKWVMVTGEESKWVKATKGLLTGKIKLVDLMQAEIAQDEEIESLVALMMEEGKDPEEDVLFDVDWLIKVETGSLAAKDNAREIATKKDTVEMGLAWGLPIDREKAWKDIAMDSGLKEPDQYLIKEGGMNGELGGIEGGAGMGAPTEPIGAPSIAGGVSGMAGQGMPAPVRPVGAGQGQLPSPIRG